MSKIFKSAITSTVKRAKGVGTRIKTALLLACAVLLNPMGAFAQSLANTGYEAGTNAMEEVATQIAAYIPYVVNLCYALAGVVAIVGAISVYIAMNNEEQDVKNILVLQNRQETRRKEMKLNSLLHNTLCRYFNFPIFENVVLKNI
jgi:molybdate-binding protein